MAGQPSKRRGDMVSKVYDELRDRILEGVYLPGRRLSQQELGEELNVGRTPLREGLRLLEADGFVISSPNRGATVADAQPDRAEELYTMRLLLEPPLVAGLVDELSEGDLDEMERHLEAMEESASDSAEFQRAHFDFHLITLKHYGQELEELILQVYTHITWHQRIYMTRPEVPDNFICADGILLDAMRAKDADTVKAILEFHLLDAAIGLVLNGEPDHRFGPLLTAARGAGIEIETNDGAIDPPAVVRWRSDQKSLAGLETANLRIGPRWRRKS
jgi:DNA-binding GntR family transcriptional regulator